jgi:hypothetical protein
MLASCKCYFIDAFVGKSGTTFLKCQPFFENAGTRPVQTRHKKKQRIFMGKENRKIIGTTIWGVHLKSGDN